MWLWKNGKNLISDSLRTNDLNGLRFQILNPSQQAVCTEKGH